MAKLCDLTGKRFGMLTVLHRAQKDYPRVYWTCRCDCGNMIDVAANNLTRGHNVSCGCRRVNPYLGKKFGKLTVLEKTNETAMRGGRRVPLWRCRCDCGNTVLVQMDSLTSGTTRSCGCLSEEKIEKMRKAAGYVGGTQLSRITNIKQTSTNSSGIVGVYYDKQTNKWASRLTFRGKRYYLGRYDSLEKAVAARKKAEAEYFGTFLESYQQKRQQSDTLQTE